MLAAGQSKRFGGIKQLADIVGVPMICHCLSPFRQGDKWRQGLAHGYVVLGSTASQISEVLPKGVETFNVDSWEQGMGHTLAQSMQHICADTSHVLIALADQITISQKQIEQLIAMSALHRQSIIAAEYNQSVGVPWAGPRQFFEELRQLSGDIGAKTVLQQHLPQVVRVAMPEAALDIDTQWDLQQANAH